MEQHRATSHVRWVILGLLTVISFVAYLLRTNMSVAGERIMTDVGLTPVQLGWVLAAFAWGYAPLPAPRRHAGRPCWAAAEALALVAGPLGRAQLSWWRWCRAGRRAARSSCIASLVALRFLMGAAQAPLFPVLGGLRHRAVVPRHRVGPARTALTNAGLTLGAAATGPADRLAGAATTAGAPRSRSPRRSRSSPPAGWCWYARDEPASIRAVRAGASSR